MANTALRGAARRVLLASSALIALPGAAQAQAATSDLSMSLKGILPIAEMQGGSATATPPQADPSVVISNPGTPSTILDQGVNGVGQMIIDQKNGFVGLCTGTLINPRTVVFAAHCVNESPTGTAMNPWNYGKGAGQLPIGFGFEADTIAGQRAWFRSNYSTSTANHFYNVNQVVYNAQSLNLGLANNFLQADVILRDAAAVIDRAAGAGQAGAVGAVAGHRDVIAGAGRVADRRGRGQRREEHRPGRHVR